MGHPLADHFAGNFTAGMPPHAVSYGIQPAAAFNVKISVV
jgi:hypothetical protein